MASLTRSLQDAVVERLSALVLEGVPVHAQVRGDLETKITAAFSQRGIIVLVLPPLIQRTNANVMTPGGGPLVDQLVVTVRVEEDLLYQSDSDNVALESGHELVERILVALTGWQPGLSAVLAKLQPEPNAVREEQQANVVILEVSFSTKATLSAPAIAADLAFGPLSSAATELYAYGCINLTPGDSQPHCEMAGMFAQVPRVIRTSVLTPTGSPVITFTEELGSRTATSFAGDLSAAPGAGYRLNWIAIL